MNLDVLIPSLLFPAPMQKLLPPPNILALEQMLARADHRVDPASEDVPWLCERWGIEAPCPVAALLAEHDGIDVSHHAWLFAEPFHHSPEQQWQKLSPARLLELTSIETSDIIAALNANFADRGLMFFAPTLARWYVRCEPGEIPVTTSIAKASFGSPLDYQPKSTGSLNWRAIQNEAQMLIFAHPVNAAREMAGKPLISGVWFWGGGVRSSNITPSYDRVVADAPLAIQLAKNAGIDVQPLTWPSVQSANGNVLAVIDDCEHLARDFHMDQMKAELERLDREWFQPIAEALRAGNIERLTLYATTAESTHTFHLKRRDLRLRFWRANKSLASYA